MGKPIVKHTAKPKLAPNMQTWGLVTEAFASGANFVDPDPISSIKGGTVTQAVDQLDHELAFQDGRALPCTARCKPSGKHHVMQGHSFNYCV